VIQFSIAHNWEEMKDAYRDGVQDRFIKQMKKIPSKEKEVSFQDMKS
jgi:hypothetical protein